MKFFLTKRSWQDEVDSIREPLQSDINEKEQIIKIIETIYNIDLHNMNTNELIITLLQNKNALSWSDFEKGCNAGAEIALNALLNKKMINKSMANNLTKAIKEYGHETLTKTKEDIDKHIIDKWRKE